MVLPYSHVRCDRDVHSASSLQESVTLQPGDTLYVARGVMHDAVANDEHVKPQTASSYLQALIDVGMLVEHIFRKEKLFFISLTGASVDAIAERITM